MYIIQHKKLFLALSGILVLISIVLVVFGGLNFGIDFTGGSLLEFEYTGKRPEISLVQDKVNNLAIGEYKLQPTGEQGYVLRTRDLEESERVGLIELLSFEDSGELVEKRFNTVGPIIGDELKQKAYIAIGVVVLAIVLFIALSFRSVHTAPRGIRGESPSTKLKAELGSPSSWKYGLVAIVALIHDIIIPTGVFALLGLFLGAEVDILFVTALLAILGFSVNDTIVVFDRIRENLRLNQERKSKESFSQTVGKSLNQTFARSINTSITTLFVLLALLILGGETTRYFALTLSIGVIAGTYSSIFLASPLLVVLNKE